MKRSKALVFAAVGTIAAFGIVASTVGAYEVKPGKGGTIKGKVLFKGDAAKANVKKKVDKDPDMCGNEITEPDILVGEGGGLQDAAVYLKKCDSGKEFPASMKKCVVDNSHCAFVPHVSFVMVGGEAVFKNTDTKLHNVKAVSPTLNFNEGIDAQKELVKKCDKADEVQLSCSVHPWMSGALWVVKHPYYVATDAKGEYALTDVPPGKYTLLCKHLKLGKPAGAEKGVEVEVKEGADTSKDFEYSN